MKLFKIRHKTVYEYPSMVQLLPHTLRLRPREGHELRIVSSKLEITPPANLIWQRDVEENCVATASFEASSRSLDINSEIIIEKYDVYPFNFLVSNYAVEFPFCYSNDDKDSLSPYMNSVPGENSSLVQEWLRRFWGYGSKTQTMKLLLQINLDIFHNMSYMKRDTEGVQPPEQTLTCGSGSCRDFAYLFMVAARQLGLAARFISGYVCTDGPTSQPGSTHAWTEVFIPGAGWKGFDPTFGVIVGAEHICVAVAREPYLVPPIAGEFYGAQGSTMTVEVSVTEVP